MLLYVVGISFIRNERSIVQQRYSIEYSTIALLYLMQMAQSLVISFCQFCQFLAVYWNVFHAL
jgi:hypothetical protein